MNSRQAAVFVILMDNGEGIVAKSPDYILEKLKEVQITDNEELLIRALDQLNLQKYYEWKARWINHLINVDELKEGVCPVCGSKSLVDLEQAGTGRKSWMCEECNFYWHIEGDRIVQV